MDHKEIIVLLIVLLVAVLGLVLLVRQGGPTGQLVSPQLRQLSFQVPNVELPTEREEVIEEPFAGRCMSDRGTYVAYLVTYKASVEYAFDGCYTSPFDGQEYYYDFYCEGTPRMSQVWVRIKQGCAGMPVYRLYKEPIGDYYDASKYTQVVKE